MVYIPFFSSQVGWFEYLFLNAFMVGVYGALFTALAVVGGLYYYVKRPSLNPLALLRRRKPTIVSLEMQAEPLKPKSKAELKLEAEISSKLPLWEARGFAQAKGYQKFEEEKQRAMLAAQNLVQTL